MHNVLSIYMLCIYMYYLKNITLSKINIMISIITHILLLFFAAFSIRTSHTVSSIFIVTAKRIM